MIELNFVFGDWHYKLATNLGVPRVRDGVAYAGVASIVESIIWNYDRGYVMIHLEYVKGYNDEYLTSRGWSK